MLLLSFRKLLTLSMLSRCPSLMRLVVPCDRLAASMTTVAGEEGKLGSALRGFWLSTPGKNTQIVVM